MQEVDEQSALLFNKLNSLREDLAVETTEFQSKKNDNKHLKINK